jgi:integrase
MAGHIEKRRNGYYAVVEVPPSLREIVGRKRLRKTLATTERATAKARVWAVVADLKARIEAARQIATGDAVKDEARTLRAALRLAASEEAESLREAINDRASELRGDPIGDISGVAPWDYEYAPEREERATAFHQLATGQATPLEESLEQWLSEMPYTPRTKGDHRRAVQRLKEWPGGAIERVEAVTKKKAGEFVSWLLRPHGAYWSGDRKTAAKYKSSLSSYWAWMKGKGLVETNPWADQVIAKARANLDGTDTKERPFTDDEMRKLLSGPADPMVADLIRMGALSGMRIDEICRLTVRGSEGGWFKVTKAKTEAGVRSVPIHFDLAAIVDRRRKGKAPDDYLFAELTDPPKGSRRERSMPASKRFSRYMRKVGAAVEVDGKRRSLTNFHSLRRWFITKAEQAGQPETIIAAVVGHKRQGMTLGGYSGGPSAEQFRNCVEAVRLPQPEQVAANNPNIRGTDHRGKPIAKR